ncbi:MAG: hypothetical protein Q7J35_14230 [Candidatus Methanoperedens sp.]|nr:hypothetical protein [Candidatus Methanoperedens sp.]
MGDEWLPYERLTDAQAYAGIMGGEVYQDAKDNTKDMIIDIAVNAYLEKKRRNIVVAAVR